MVAPGAPFCVVAELPSLVRHPRRPERPFRVVAELPSLVRHSRRPECPFFA